MPEDMSGAEQERPRMVNVSHAEYWVNKRGLQTEGETLLGRDALTNLAQEAYELFLSKQDLQTDILRKNREVQEGGQTKIASLDEKLKLLSQGRANDILASLSNQGTFAEVVTRSKERLGEIEQRLDQVLTTPGVYERYQEGYHQQIGVIKRAKEVATIGLLVDRINLITVKLSRDAQVQGRSLTDEERKVIEENRQVQAAAEVRQQALLKDAEVFDRVRLQEIRSYREQLQKDKFAETPSRKKYLEKIERYWAEGKRVLASGETGTGKTELIKHASNKLFEVNPESVTGHQDMSIYELLGKTGFRVQEGDVFRPAPLVRAMTGRDGKGQPFLFDEIDRSPNQSVMGIKTILNARPGERGIKVQTDSAGSFDVGKDYAVAATANIKSEKHTTATELDPAIVRVFDAPMDIDYMPAYEVYDLALASLTDKRGGILLSEDDARTLLKNLCDAASWIQDAYQGRKVVTDPSGKKFLEAKGQASTGKPATLKKALLDPGRTLDMLKGWNAANAQGQTFESYVNERILEFINNRAYPEDDRYYLTEIFAIKGFLKGHKVSDFLVSGLDQATLGKWTGTKAKKRAIRREDSYMPWNRVVKLDPYKKLKRPAAQEAEELLSENTRENKEDMPPVDFEWARNLFGEKFFGADAVEKAFGVRLSPDQIPDIADKFTPEELSRYQELGMRLELRINKAKDGSPLTMRKITQDLQDEFTNSGKGNILYAFNRSKNDAWYEPDPIFTTETPKPEWVVVSDSLLPDSTSKNYLQQTELLENFIINEVYKGQQLPQEYQEAINEFEQQKQDISGLMTDRTWKQAADKLAALKINQLFRHSPVEVIYDMVLVVQNTDHRFLPDKWTWTKGQSQNGRLVYVGDSDAEGACVDDDRPRRSNSPLGVAFSR